MKTIKQIRTLGLVLILSFLAININAQDIDSTQTETPLKKGIYMSYQEFLNNSPSRTDSFVVFKKARETEIWKGTYACYPRFSDTKPKIRKIYGFCDGEKQYVYHELEYFEVEKTGEEYSFWGYGSVANQNTVAGDVACCIGFGIVGVILKDESEKVQLRRQRQNYVIEGSNGKAYTRENFEKIGMGLIIYRRAKKENEDLITITVNDSLSYSYIPNSYLDLFYKLSDEHVKICVEGNDSCLNIKRDAIKTKYIKLSSLKGTDQISLEEVDTEQGEYESVAPMKNQKVYPIK